MNFHERKAARTAYYFKFEYRWKKVKCTACNGSGYYDGPGQHDCSGCDGTGKEFISPKDYEIQREYEAKWRGLD